VREGPQQGGGRLRNYRGEENLAKKALVEKQKRKAKYKVREYNRCHRCGRSRAYLRDFGLCRICFRELALQGEIPGVTKASW